MSTTTRKTMNLSIGSEIEFNYAKKVPEGEIASEFEKRRILLTNISFNTTSWSTLLRGYDLDKGQYRTFDTNRIECPSLKYIRG